MNFIAGEVETLNGGTMRFRGKSGVELNLPVAALAPKTGEAITIGVRPEHLRIVEPSKGMLAGEVQIAEHLGGETFLYVTLPTSETIVVEIQGQTSARPGERVGVDFEAGAHHLFSGDGSVVPATPR
jgi:multiple sugar transport system ATP-binding protein